MSAVEAWAPVAEPGTPEAAALATTRREGREQAQAQSDDEPRKSAASLLVELAEERYTFGSTPEGDAYAAPKGAGGHVVRMLRGGRSSLRAELAAAYRKATGRIAPQQALADALLVIEGMAQDMDPRPVRLRVGEAEGAVWVDLGDIDGRAVRVDADGWRVVSESVPVLFRRTALTGALPEPTRGGNIADLWQLLNVTEADRPLVLAWLVAAILRPEIPHPILALFGEQGVGKSTTARTLVRLVDPSPVPLRKPPRDADGWVTAASGSWVVGLDNLSTVSEWLSDSLCRAATGDGDVRRALYTDAQLAVFAFRRVVLLNGIDVGAMRGDLAERLIVVNMARIADRARLTEAALDRAWVRAHPALFGALLDLTAGVAGVISDLHLDTSPRMADFAHILAAVDQITGSVGLVRYAEQAATIARDTLDSDPFLSAMARRMTAPFQGPASELRHLVTPGDDDWRAPRDWPKDARHVTTLLRRHAPALRSAGWVIEDQGSANKARVTEWLVSPPEKVCNPSPPSLPSLPSQVSGSQVAGQAGHGREPDAAAGREAGQAGHGYGQSQDDEPDPFPSCAVCGWPLDRVLAAAGVMTHPDCNPEGVG